MNVSENSFLSFDSFQRKFNLKCTFLQYFGLLAAILRQCKDLLNVQDSQETPTSQLTIDKLTCKEGLDNERECSMGYSVPSKDS